MTETPAFKVIEREAGLWYCIHGPSGIRVGGAFGERDGAEVHAAMLNESFRLGVEHEQRKANVTAEAIAHKLMNHGGYGMATSVQFHNAHGAFLSILSLDELTELIAKYLRGEIQATQREEG